MTRVALFGGSFNPPHVAHQLVALYVLETQPVDELWFVPTYAHPFGKPLRRLRAPDRDVRARGARRSGPRARVSRAEAELAARPGFVASRTLDLVEPSPIAPGPRAAPRDRRRHPRRRRPSGTAGTTWSRGAPPIVVGRGGHALPPGSAATGSTMPEISATHIRDLLARGDSGAAGASAA